MFMLPKNMTRHSLVVFLQVPGRWSRRRVQPLDRLPGCQLGSLFGQATEGRLQPGLPDGDGQVVDGRADLGHVARVLDIRPEIGQDSLLAFKSQQKQLFNNILGRDALQA